eukprot:scaffold9738_cov131-Alexandrium_tamarense.AAC.2
MVSSSTFLTANPFVSYPPPHPNATENLHHVESTSTPKPEYDASHTHPKKMSRLHGTPAMNAISSS